MPSKVLQNISNGLSQSLKLKEYRTVILEDFYINLMKDHSEKKPDFKFFSSSLDLQMRKTPYHFSQERNVLFNTE